MSPDDTRKEIAKYLSTTSPLYRCLNFNDSLNGNNRILDYYKIATENPRIRMNMITRSVDQDYCTKGLLTVGNLNRLRIPYSPSHEIVMYHYSSTQFMTTEFMSNQMQAVCDYMNELERLGVLTDHRYNVLYDILSFLCHDTIVLMAKLRDKDISYRMTLKLKRAVVNEMTTDLMIKNNVDRCRTHTKTWGQMIYGYCFLSNNFYKTMKRMIDDSHKRSFVDYQRVDGVMDIDGEAMIRSITGSDRNSHNKNAFRRIDSEDSIRDTMSRIATRFIYDILDKYTTYSRSSDMYYLLRNSVILSYSSKEIVLYGLDNKYRSLVIHLINLVDDYNRSELYYSMKLITESYSRDIYEYFMDDWWVNIE